MTKGSTLQEHLAILKQGVEVWNEWRNQHPEVNHPDLIGARLTIEEILRATGAELGERPARLAKRGSIFALDTLAAFSIKPSRLFEVDLLRANLLKINLAGAHLEKVDLTNADLSGANLSFSNLSEADLRNADLSGANLSGATLQGADLSLSNLSVASLDQTDFSAAKVGWTIFGNVDLATGKGLDTVEHLGPSIIGLDTIYRSKGNISKVFLKGAGVPNTFFAYMHVLIEPLLDYYTYFISYSSQDATFVNKLHASLQQHGVRCWFAPKDLKIGDRIRSRIDKAIHQQDKLLLLLSKHSIASPWVENEVEAALEKEDLQQREVLFPICLDNAMMQTSQAWAATLRRTRHIGDFTHLSDFCVT